MKRTLFAGIAMILLMLILSGCGSTGVVKETYEKKVETSQEIVIE